MRELMDWRGPKVVIVVVMATPLFGSSGSSVWTGITYRPLRGGGGGRLVVWASSGERLFMGCILMMPPRGTICSVGNAWDCLMSRCGGMGRWMASARR